MGSIDVLGHVSKCNIVVNNDSYSSTSEMAGKACNRADLNPFKLLGYWLGVLVILISSCSVLNGRRFT